MVYDEIHAIVKRYGDESDITIFQVVGVLEAVKLDLLEWMNEEDDDDDDDANSKNCDT